MNKAAQPLGRHGGHALATLDAAHKKLKALGLIPNPRPDPMRDALRAAIAKAKCE